MKKHGKQTKAGQLLSHWLRTISEEVTEFVKDPVTGEDRIASKAEALARLMWRDALGYSKMVKGKSGEVETIVAPVRAAANIIFDRTEGRVPNSTVEGSEKLTAADKVTEQGAKRIADAGKKKD